MVNKWIPKELADDYSIGYDILRRTDFYVHIDDPDYQEKIDRYIKETTLRKSLWSYIKHLWNVKLPIQD